MKRKITATTAIILLAALSSCDSKTCKCYTYNGQSTPTMDYEYVSEGTSCSTLDYNRGTQYRTCLEYSEPDIDPGDIGQEYKSR